MAAVEKMPKSYNFGEKGRQLKKNLVTEDGWNTVTKVQFSISGCMDPKSVLAEHNANKHDAAQQKQ